MMAGSVLAPRCSLHGLALPCTQQQRPEHSVVALPRSFLNLVEELFALRSRGDAKLERQRQQALVDGGDHLPALLHRCQNPRHITAIRSTKPGLHKVPGQLMPDLRVEIGTLEHALKHPPE